MKDDELDALLTKGAALSGPERDRVLAGVLRRVQPSASAARGRVVAIGLVVLGAAAAVVLAMSAARHPLVALSSRGGEATESPVEVVCTAGTLSACPHGSHLLFRSHRSGYLAAYAQPMGGGERIWYFTADAEAPLVGKPAADRLLERVVVVGPEHTPGAYAVHVVVGSHPLSSAEALDAKSAAVVASEVVRLEVTP